jgi:hypothetical protein
MGLFFRNGGEPQPLHQNMSLFYAATKLGNKLKAPFWDAPWLNREKQKSLTNREVLHCKSKNHGLCRWWPKGRHVGVGR